MTQSADALSLEALREEFDRSFASVPPSPAPSEDFLEVVAGTLTCLLRLSELRAIAGRLRVTPVPTPVRELMGVAEFRGNVLPVYDLAALLGQPGAAPATCVAIASARPVGLACERTGRHHRARTADVLAHADGAAPGLPHVREVLQAADGVRPIVSLAALLADIERRVKAPRSLEDDTRR